MFVSRYVSLLLLCSLILGMPIKLLAMPGEELPAGSTGWFDNIPTYLTPPKLQDVWLRFHEENLCQKLDANFRFHNNGMEVYINVIDEKSYQKFVEMMEPLYTLYQIDLHTTWPPEEEEPANDRCPPPSLCENSELLAYLRDPFLQNSSALGTSIQINSGNIFPSDDLLKMRMLMFAEQVLDHNKKMKRYAMDIPILTQAAFDSTATPEFKFRAVAVCRRHAQKVEKYAMKLIRNLTMALPKPLNHNKTTRHEDSFPAEMTLIDRAESLAAEAQSVAIRVYHFIHPQHHTVGLADLREPSLLQSLWMLEKMATDYQNSLSQFCKE